jgi:hypothetical protein
MEERHGTAQLLIFPELPQTCAQQQPAEPVQTIPAYPPLVSHETHHPFESLPATSELLTDCRDPGSRRFIVAVALNQQTEFALVRKG